MNVAAKAAAWIDRLKSADAKEREEFWNWIAASPIHVREILLAEQLDRELGSFDFEKRIDVRALIEEAASNVVVIHQHRAAAEAEAAASPRRFGWKAAAGVGAALVAVALAVYLYAVSATTYATGVGQQLVSKLDDGSVVYLDAESKVKVRFSATTRDLYLPQGQALFQVAHDPSRPFRVHAESAVVEAIGTRFDVRVLADRTTVAVVEGTVEVAPAAVPSGRTGTAPPARHVAGEGATIAVGGEVERQPSIDVSNVTAWLERRLVFIDQPLSWIAAEFNRYNVTPRLRVVGDALGARRFNGTFNAHNPESLANYLGQDASIVIERQPDEIVVRSAR
jgi:transmembrane sensor